jgi:hypothetical protein
MSRLHYEVESGGMGGSTETHACCGSDFRRTQAPDRRLEASDLPGLPAAHGHRSRADGAAYRLRA